MKEDDGAWKELATVKSYDNDYKVPNLKPNKKYDFAVVAENKAGRGDAMETLAPTVLKEKPKKAGKLDCSLLILIMNIAWLFLYFRRNEISDISHEF